MPAERAWLAPMLLRQRLGHLDPARIAVEESAVRDAIQAEPKLHRYIEKMPAGSSSRPKHSDCRANRAHSTLIRHVAAGGNTGRRGPLDPHGLPPSSSAIASSCETAPGRPAATHSR